MRRKKKHLKPGDNVYLDEKSRIFSNNKNGLCAYIGILSTVKKKSIKQGQKVKLSISNKGLEAI